MPKLQGVDVSPFFTKEFYQKKIPIWTMSDKQKLYGDIGKPKKQEKESNNLLPFDKTQIALLIFQLLLFLVTVYLFIRNVKKNNA